MTTPPRSASSGRRRRLVPKPITGFGHSLSEDDAAAAGALPAAQEDDSSRSAAFEPRDVPSSREPIPVEHEAPPAAAPLRSVPAEFAGSLGAASGLKDARGLVSAARSSARDRPREWETFTARLPLGLADRLTLRLARDKRATGDYGLAASHYLNAALSQIPDDIESAAQWGLDWRARSTDIRTLTRGSGSRLHRDVVFALHELSTWLPTLAVHPRTWEVMAEALTRLLDALDANEAAV